MGWDSCANISELDFCPGQWLKWCLSNHSPYIICKGALITSLRNQDKGQAIQLFLQKSAMVMTLQNHNHNKEIENHTFKPDITSEQNKRLVKICIEYWVAFSH